MSDPGVPDAEVTAAPALELAVDDDTGVALAVPPGWSRVDLTGFQLALAADRPVPSAGDGSTFRPNVNVLVSQVAATADASLVGTEAVVGFMISHDDGRVLAYDVWPGPEGVEGRRLVMAYRDGASTLCVVQWVFVRAGAATTVTATYPVTAMETADVLVHAAVAGLRLAAPGRGPGPEVDGEPVERPRTDAYLASVGEPYEDISAIAGASPYLGGGPVVARGLVEMLAAGAARRGGPRLPRAARKDPALTALVAAELATPDAELTDAGREIAATLAGPVARLRVESARGRTPLALDASVRGGRAVVVATASPAALTEEPRGEDILRLATQVTLDWVDVSYLPLLIASWVGLSPAWSLATSPETLPERLIVQRVDDPALPAPSDADRNLRHAWEQPWFMWTLRGEGIGDGRVAVNAGRAGQIMLLRAPQEGMCLFRALPAGNVWADLVGYVRRVVTAAPAS